MTAPIDICSLIRENKRIFHQLLTKFVQEEFVRDIGIADIHTVRESFVSDVFLPRETDLIYQVEAGLREAVDQVVELIHTERPEELWMFANWLNRMFRRTLEPEEIETITRYTGLSIEDLQRL